MAKRGRKPKKVEEVEVKEKKVKEVKEEKTKGKKVKEEKIEVQEALFKDDDFEVEDSDSFEEYDDEELEDDKDEVVSKKEETEELEDEVIVKNDSNELKNIKLISIVSLCVSVVTLILTLVVLNKVSGNRSYSTENESSTDGGSEEVVGYDVSKFESITADDFIDMFEEDDTYFVYTGRSTCGYCVQFVPVLNQSIEEYDYTVHYLDVSTVDDEDYETIIGLDEELENNFGYTPMVFVIRDGEVVDVNEGFSEYEGYQTFLKDNGIEKK